MDEQTRKQVQHFVRADAWPAWEAQFATPGEQQAAEDLAFSVEGSARGVAAYILESLAASAAVTSTEGSPAVKRMKDGGEEIEYFPAQNTLSVRAQLFADRAAQLRAQITTRIRRSNPAPEFERWGLE